MQGLNGVRWRYPNTFEFGGDITSTPARKWDEVFLNHNIAEIARERFGGKNILENQEIIHGIFSNPTENVPAVILQAGEDNSDDDD